MCACVCNFTPQNANKIELWTHSSACIFWEWPIACIQSCFLNKNAISWIQIHTYTYRDMALYACAICEPHVCGSIFHGQIYAIAFFSCHTETTRARVREGRCVEGQQCPSMRCQRLVYCCRHRRACTCNLRISCFYLLVICLVNFIPFRLFFSFPRLHPIKAFTLQHQRFGCAARIACNDFQFKTEKRRATKHKRQHTIHLSSSCRCCDLWYQHS